MISTHLRHWHTLVAPLLQQPAPAARWWRAVFPIEAVDLYELLQQYNGGQRGFWKCREGTHRVAALGEAWSQPLHRHDDIEPVFQAGRAVLSEFIGVPQLFHYLSFSDQPEQTWPAFGYGKLWLPHVEVSETAGNYQLAINVYCETESDWLTSLQQALQLLDPNNYTTIDVHNAKLNDIRCLPTADQWKDIVHQLQQQFAAGTLQKAVLSRQATVDYRGSISPWRMLRGWQQANPNSYQFYVDGEASCYFGCSPERLFQRQGHACSTEALAGTIARGETPELDEQLAQQLMSDGKNIHENRLVLDDICHKLAPLTSNIEYDSGHSIVKLQYIQHLRYQIRAQLNDAVADEDVLRVLHPTPAIGGAPQEAAQTFIVEHEPYARGLYAGVFGVVGLAATDLCVAIRSARLTTKAIHLYSGAGIVPSSNAVDEWNELNHKIATVRGLLPTKYTTMDE